MSSPFPAIQPLSWRDPDGRVFDYGGKLWRSLRPSRLCDIQDLLEQSWFVESMSEGRIAQTHLVQAPSDLLADWNPSGWLLQHKRIATPAYPHEINALQLWHSARLTLELALHALDSGWMLKDASAWNVLHAGGRPCFIDVLSFERHNGSGIWIAYAQFMRHFLIPLILHKRMGIQPHQLFLTHRDGVTPEEALRQLPWQGLWRLSALEAIVLPGWLAGTARRNGVGGVHPSRSHKTSVGAHLLQQTLRRLQKYLESLKPRSRDMHTIWADYESDRAHYTEPSLRAKRDGVIRLLSQVGPATVLDMGCNAGEFSLLALQAIGVRRVLAADSDPGALIRLQERLDASPAPVYPIVLDIGRPTPAVGWCNREVASALERLTGQVDLVMALGLLHHLIVSERIPLPEIGRMLGGLAAPWLLLEWVPPQDPRFKEIAANNSELYENLSLNDLQEALQPYFVLETTLQLQESLRTLTLWRRVRI